MTSEWGSIAEWVQAIITAVGLGIAIGLAWWQSHVYKNVELFERRFRIYVSVHEFFKRPEYSQEDVEQLRKDCYQASFLFGKDVQDFMSRTSELLEEITYHSRLIGNVF